MERKKSEKPIKRMLKPREAAELLGISIDMLQRMRTEGRGPRYAKYGSGRTAPIRYDIDDLEVWLEEQKLDSIFEGCT